MGLLASARSVPSTQDVDVLSKRANTDGWEGMDGGWGKEKARSWHGEEGWVGMSAEQSSALALSRYVLMSTTHTSAPCNDDDNLVGPARISQRHDDSTQTSARARPLSIRRIIARQRLDDEIASLRDADIHHESTYSKCTSGASGCAARQLSFCPVKANARCKEDG